MLSTKKCLFIFLCTAFYLPVFGMNDGEFLKNGNSRRGTPTKLESLEKSLKACEADLATIKENFAPKTAFDDLKAKVQTIEGQYARKDEFTKAVEEFKKQQSPWFKLPSLSHFNTATYKAFGLGLFSYALAGLNYWGGGYLVSDRYGSKIGQHVTTGTLIGAGTAYTSAGVSSALGNEKWQSRFNQTGNWLLVGSLVSLGAGQCGGQMTAQLAKSGSAWAAHNGSYYANQIAQTIKNYRKN